MNRKQPVLLQNGGATKQQPYRPLQASKQMAYDVFGNVITALETFEEREAISLQRRVPPKSNIYIPDQTQKDDEDVQAVLEAQLQVFEAHLTYCPKQIVDELRPEMKKLMVHWSSARGHLDQTPATKSDAYSAKLYEIVDTGKTEHDYTALLKPCELTQDEIMTNLQLIGKGRLQAEKLDQSFTSDPNKKAETPAVRRGTNPIDGLSRLNHVGHNLKQSLQRLSTQMGITETQLNQYK